MNIFYNFLKVRFKQIFSKLILDLATHWHEFSKPLFDGVPSDSRGAPYANTPIQLTCASSASNSTVSRVSPFHRGTVSPDISLSSRS